MSLAPPPSDMIIEPRRQGVSSSVKEAWRYRRLTRFFAERALEKLYKRTLLGRVWLWLRPLVDIGVKALIFGAVLGASSGTDVPYPVFFAIGMTLWHCFDFGTMWTTRSLEINRRLVTKMYFPRLLVPIASIAPALYQFGVGLVICTVAVLVYWGIDGEIYIEFGPELLLAPVALFLALSLAIAIGLWTSVPGAQMRDVRFTLRYVMEMWVFFTPIIYPLTALPDSIQPIASLNPMTPVVEMFKLALLGEGTVETHGIIICVAVIVITGVTGLRFFARAEAEAVDKM